MSTNNVELPKPKAKDDINILLLGESGVGKSTFINSFLNYIQFNTFEDACEKCQHIRCVIPTKFTMLDDEFNERIIQHGSSDNESRIAGDSATLGTKSYVVRVPNYNRYIRLIDTPGIGDTRGIIDDEKNQRNIINYLSTIDYINTICVLLKPNQARCTIAFQYCINQLLLYLDKTCIDNVMFVFTNTSGTFFTPGETIHPLRKILKEIEEQQNVTIRINKENTFSVDNESFHYLLAKKDNITLGHQQVFSNSFAHSRTEFLRLLERATNIEPYIIGKTLYLYKTRQKFEDICNSYINLSRLLKSDSTLLKKLYNAVSNSDLNMYDANNQIQEIEGRLSKYEDEKHNFNVQISKFYMYLRTNSMVLFNDYSQQYIDYLIDREMSIGIAVDKKCIRDYRLLTNYYEEIKKIINLHISTDETNPVLTREELSSMFPQLEEDIVYSRCENEVIVDEIEPASVEGQNNLETESGPDAFTFVTYYDLFKDSATNQDEYCIDVDSICENEVFVDEIEPASVQGQNNLETESGPDAFTFVTWYDLFKESATNQNKDCIDLKEFKKTNIKQEHSSKNIKPNLSGNNQDWIFCSNHKVPFKKQQTNKNHFLKTSNETSSMMREIPSHRHQNTNRNTNYRGNASKFSDKSHVNHSKFVDYRHKPNRDANNHPPDAGPYQVRTANDFRGRGRGGAGGRGRGDRGGNHQTYKKEKYHNPNIGKQFEAVSQENKLKYTGRRKVADTEDTSVPKNLFQSMKDIFD